MKTLKSPKDEMTSRYQTVPPCHTVLVPFEIASFLTFRHEEYSEVQTVLNPKGVQEKQHPQSAASSLEVSLTQEDQRDGMGCFEGRGVLIRLMEKILHHQKHLKSRPSCSPFSIGLK